MAYRIAAIGGLTLALTVAVVVVGSPLIGAGTVGAVSAETVSPETVSAETGRPEAIAAPRVEAAPSSTKSMVGMIVGAMETTAVNVAWGATAAVETGEQMAKGAYDLGGELLRSGGILGLQALQTIGLVSEGGADDRRRLGEQGVADAWAGTGRSSAAGTSPVVVPPLTSRRRALSDSAGIEPRPDTGATESSLCAVNFSTASAGSTPGASMSTSATPETIKPLVEPIADADECNWTNARGDEQSPLTGDDVSLLSQLGLMTESAQRLPDGSIFLPKVTQRLLQLRTAFSCKGRISTTSRLVGHVIANPTSSGLVQAEQDGRIEASEMGFPVIGQRVEKGELLGYLVPTMSSRERAGLVAEIEIIRGEIAEQELAIARTRELPLLPFREGRILSMRLDLNKLRAKRDALTDGLTGRQMLIASVSGVVARAEVRVGQVVEARQLLWEIADNNDLWVEADSFGTQARVAQTGSTAETQDGQVMDLALQGLGMSTDGGQSSPIQFRVVSLPDGVRIGEQVVVTVRETGASEGIMVPKSALVRRGNGEMMVWVAKGPEQYERRRVKWSPAGSHLAMIEAGLDEGVRVVVAGATMLAEVR